MASEDSEGREMTLDEWVESLPGPHRAKRELAELKSHGYDKGFAAGFTTTVKLKQESIADLERQLQATTDNYERALDKIAERGGEPRRASYAQVGRRS